MGVTLKIGVQTEPKGSKGLIGAQKADWGHKGLIGAQKCTKGLTGADLRLVYKPKIED